MSDEAAFEAALRTNPDDFAGWCAYADYLVEQGDPRGEFMQVQLALEDESRPKAERDALKAREAELLAAHEREWVGAWADQVEAPTDTEGRGQINHTGGRKYEFRRGVLAVANFGRLTVHTARAFVAAPETRFVRELFIGDSYDDDEFEPGPDVPIAADEQEVALYALMRWPHFGNIRRFQYGWLADEDYDGWCHFQCHQRAERLYDLVGLMPHIEELLVFAHFRAEVLDQVAAMPLPNLRALQLYHGWDYPLAELAQNRSLTKLTHLLCHPHALEYGNAAYIRQPGLSAICRSPYLTNLTHLRLRLADFGDGGVQEIIDSGILKRLKVLDLRHGCITDAGAKLLAECPDLKNLEHLDLSRNAIEEEGFEALKATKVPVNLEHQHGETDGGDEGEPGEYLSQGDYE